MTAAFYDLLYVLPLTVLAVLSGKPWFGAPEEVLPTLLCALTVTAVCMALKHLQGRWKLLLPGVLFALCAGVILIRDAEDRAAFLAEYRWILTVAVTAFVAFLPGILAAYFRIVRLLLSLLLFVLMITAMVLSRPADKACVALAFFLILLTAADEVRRSLKKNGQDGVKGYMVSLAPFFLLPALMVYLVPAPEKPYDWRIAVRVIEIVQAGIKTADRWFSSFGEEFGGEIGFSENGSFWGALSGGERKMMSLDAGHNVGTVVYLRGRVMDTFDGRNWTFENGDSGDERAFDVLETLSAADRYDPKFTSDYVRKAGLTISYDDFSTAYVFTPAKVTAPFRIENGGDLVASGGEFLSTKPLGFGTSYNFTYLRLNRGQERLEGLLDNASAPDADAWAAACALYESDLTYEEYQAYQARVRAVYLPETGLSDRADAYLAELLAGAESDAEKLRRVEALLSSCTYNTAVENLPGEVQTTADFVDYVLFDKREGYCNHYATAFVLIARHLGIPARFVQGFLVPYQADTKVAVMSSMAHAWPEAYLPGVGWISYEPTPGRIRAATWRVAKRPEENAASVQTEREEIQLPDLPPEEEAAKEQTDAAVSWRIILIPLALVLAFLLLFFVADRIAAGYRYRRMREPERFRVTVKKNFRLLQVLGFVPAQGETLQELGLRAAGQSGGEGLRFLSDCETALYADLTPDGTMRKQAEEDHESLLNRIRAEKGRLAGWFWKVVG